MSEQSAALPVQMRVSDMRPREAFEAGDKVSCPCGQPGTGVVVKIEPDRRLARVQWGTGHLGWWYLKDLVING